MFISQLSSLGPLVYEGKHQRINHLQVDALEFQYELCQMFLRKTGQQLHYQEAQAMQDTTQLLRYLKRNNSEKVINISTDSGGQQSGSSMRDLHSLPTQDSSRRSDGSAWRKLDGRVGVWMSELEENCSALCVANIRAIINDYRRLLERLWEVESRENLLDRKNQHFQREHQQNLILKQKVHLLEAKLVQQNIQMQTQRQKNQDILKYADQKLREMMGNQKMIEINEKVFHDVKSYLEDKQKNLTRRSQKVQKLEESLLERLTSLSEGCEGCCQMMRKLKQSLLRFKKYLEGEGTQLQNLINKYKKTLLHRSCRKL